MVSPTLRNPALNLTLKRHRVQKSDSCKKGDPRNVNRRTFTSINCIKFKKVYIVVNFSNTNRASMPSARQLSRSEVLDRMVALEESMQLRDWSFRMPESVPELRELFVSVERSNRQDGVHERYPTRRGELKAVLREFEDLRE